MKYIYTLLILLLLFCFKEKNQNINESKKADNIVEIHLSRTMGMIDMTKNISKKYYSLNRDKIYIIKELNSPKGEVIKTDTVKIIIKDNSEIFRDLENENKLVSFFSDGLQDDSNGWAFSIYYANKQEKNFTFTSSDKIPKYAIKLNDLLNELERNN